MSHDAASIGPRVLIHALRLGEGPTGHRGGNYSHVMNLVRALAEPGALRLKVICDEVSRPELATFLKPEQLVEVRLGGGGVLRADWAVVRAIAAVQPQVYHRPTGQLPFFRVGCPAVATIADLNFRVLPMPPGKRWYKEASYRRTVRRADFITCISQYTRQELMRFHPVDPARVSVIHHGATALPAADDTAVARMGGAYWLTFGHQAHKNVETCLLALARRPPEERLAVVGWCPHVEHVLQPMAAQLGLAQRVVFLGRVSDAALHGLYRRALGLLFLSRYEGFGLPVLEAMAAGCAVVSSNVCSLPEVVGNAAIMVAPGDLEGVLAGMARIVGDEGEIWRAQGRRRAAEFTWSEAGRRTLAVYAEVSRIQR